jgi:hypothetical protein
MTGASSHAAADSALPNRRRTTTTGARMSATRAAASLAVTGSASPNPVARLPGGSDDRGVDTRADAPGEFAPGLALEVVDAVLEGESSFAGVAGLPCLGPGAFERLLGGQPLGLGLRELPDGIREAVPRLALGGRLGHLAGGAEPTLEGGDPLAALLEPFERPCDPLADGCDLRRRYRRPLDFGAEFGDSTVLGRPLAERPGDRGEGRQRRDARPVDEADSTVGHARVGTDDAVVVGVSHGTDDRPGIDAQTGEVDRPTRSFDPVEPDPHVGNHDSRSRSRIRSGSGWAEPAANAE